MLQCFCISYFTLEAMREVACKSANTCYKLSPSTKELNAQTRTIVSGHRGCLAALAYTGNAPTAKGDGARGQSLRETWKAGKCHRLG